MGDGLTGDPRSADGHQWVKTVLGLDVHALRQDAGDAGGGAHRKTEHHHGGKSKPKHDAAPAALSPAEEQARRSAFDQALEPLHMKLVVAQSHTAKLPNPPGEIRAAEMAAQAAQDAAKAAADQHQWDKTEKLLAAATSAMTALDDVYLLAANDLDARIGRRLSKLEKLADSLQGTNLDGAGAKKARDSLSLAQAKANQFTGFARLEALGAVAAQADKAATENAGMLQGKGNRGAIEGMQTLRKNVADAIGKVGDPARQKGLNDRLAAWDKQVADAGRESDAAKQKPLLDAAEKIIRKLLESALMAGGGDDGAAKLQKAYKETLEKRYGLTIKVPKGMENTHFDKVLDMMEMIPVEHASQSSLKKLVYSASEKGGVFYTFGSKVQMGDFGDGAGTDAGYHNPLTGKPEPLNAFSVTTLHEIGHSVDDKYRIMSRGNMAKEGMGGWHDNVSVSTITDLFAKEYLNGDGKGGTLSESDLKSMIHHALKKGETGDQPKKMPPDEWARLKPVLERAGSLLNTKSPWERTVAFDGVAYHEAYSGEWVGYSVEARKNCEIHKYQFRSPAEWFAELYAYTWFSKKKPPSGVDKIAARYLYGGDA